MTVITSGFTHEFSSGCEPKLPCSHFRFHPTSHPFLLLLDVYWSALSYTQTLCILKKIMMVQWVGIFVWDKVFVITFSLVKVFVRQKVSIMMFRLTSVAMYSCAERCHNVSSFVLVLCVLHATLGHLIKIVVLKAQGSRISQKWACDKYHEGLWLSQPLWRIQSHIWSVTQIRDNLS